MQFIRVREIHNDPSGYNYGVNFINNTNTSKNFAKYSKRLGQIAQKQYDNEERYWKIYKKDLAYLLEIEQEPEEGTEPVTGTDPIEPWMVMDPSIGTKEVPEDDTTKEIPLMSSNPQQYTKEELEHIGGSLKLKPYPYQKELIKFCTDHPETLLVAACGAGNICLV